MLKWAVLLRCALASAVAALSMGCLETDYVLQQQNGGSGAGGSSTAGESGAGPVCGTEYTPGNAFAVCAASYLGSSGVDALEAAAVGPSGTVLIAGRTARSAWSSPSLDVDGPASGVALLLSEDGRSIDALARVGDDITDVELDADGALLATTSGVFALSAGLERVVWPFRAAGAVTRLALSGQTIAALTASGNVLVLSRSGAQQSSFALADDSLDDIAVSEALGLIYVTGSHPVASGGCSGRMPFLRAYDLNGGLRWKAYDFNDAGTWCASSRGRRLALGTSGKLFYAGEQEGGNSVHLRDPGDLSAQAPLMAYDAFSQGSGKAIETYTFVARFDAEQGNIEIGEVILPRQNGVGSTLLTSALAVDESGQVFVGGQVGCCLDAREQRSFAGALLGNYSGVEASLVILSQDFAERRSWTSFSKAGGANATVEALAVGAGIAVASLSADSDVGTLLTHQPLEAEPGGGLDGYWMTFPAPP